MIETIKEIQNLPGLQMVGALLVTALAALTAFFANKNIAVYNDGVRPLVGQKKQGNIDYKTLVVLSFSMSIGYVAGFIPFSIASKIIIVHAVLLGSEIIGLSFKNNKMHTILATLLAAFYGLGLHYGLNQLGVVIGKTSYPGFGWQLGLIGDGAFSFIFAMFPVVATYSHSGFKKGAFSLVISITTYILVSTFGWAQYNLYPMAVTLLVGTIVFFAIASKGVMASSSSSSTLKEDDLQKGALEIKAHKWWFVLSGSIAAMAVASFSIAPLVSLASQNAGQLYAAVIADLSWVIGFIPLVVLTALLTGVYSPIGLTAVLLFGTIGKIVGVNQVISSGQISSYWMGIGLAGILGALSMFVEVHMLEFIAKYLQKLPGIQKLSDALRTGIIKTVNVAFLFGGVIAAYKMGEAVANLIKVKAVFAGLAIWLPSMSAGLVLVFLVINRMAKRKLAELAVGPVGALMVGILLNILWKISTIV